MAERTYYVCFLKKFNNYFNRIIKGYSTLEEYQNASEDFYLFDKPINWNPKDNVSTELIMNDCPFDADYLLVLDEESNIVSRWFIMETVFTRNKQYRHDLRRDVIYDNLEKLKSSPVFVEKGWLQDSNPLIFNPEGMSFNEIKTDEILLKDDSDVAWIIGYIAKNAAAEEITIQVGEESLPDSITLEDIASDLGISISTLNSLLNYNNSINNPAYFCEKVAIKFGTSSADLVPWVWKNIFYFSSDFSSYLGYMGELVASWAKTLYKYKTMAVDLDNRYRYEIADKAIYDGIIGNKASILLSMPTIFNRPYLTQEQYNKLQSYVGRLIKYNDKYYKLALNIAGTNQESVGPAIYTSFAGISGGISAGASTSNFTDNATFHNDGEISITLTGTLAYINLNDEEITSEVPAIRTKIPTTRNGNKNNSFDLFAIPFGALSILTTAYGTFTNIASTAKRVASEIAVQLDASCYDVQLLPYCPLPEYISNKKILDARSLTADVDFTLIYQDYAGQTLSRVFKGTDYDPQGESGGYWGYRIAGFKFMENVYNTSLSVTETVVSGGDLLAGPVSSSVHVEDEVAYLSSFFYTDHELTEEELRSIQIIYTVSITAADLIAGAIFWLKTDSFRTTIKQTLSLKDSLKVESECNKYRLCSPNYQGSFDFNVAKNGGSVDYFIAECTYKPYTPYLKVAPQFKLLYGSNFSDARGLICGGDYSLSRFTDAWESFELQNKNYQNIFNREIQNLDINQQLNWERSLITGGLGIATAGAVGAVGGVAATGSPWGALAGGILGTAGSAIGMKFDIDMLQRQQRETKQYAIDKYNYQLGNIKALPYTLTKIGAFNINSKIWPFVEYYTCTDEEKDALEKKLQYESMTVMRIALFGDFWAVAEDLKYFKGQLIRNEEIAEDNHIFEAIYTEIAKGVYM